MSTEQNENGQEQAQPDTQEALVFTELSVHGIIRGLAAGKPEVVHMASIPPVPLEDIDHYAFDLITHARQYVTDAVQRQTEWDDWEPDVEQLVNVFQECIFWLQFFATLVAAAPTPPISERNCSAPASERE